MKHNALALQSLALIASVLVLSAPQDGILKWLVQYESISFAPLMLAVVYGTAVVIMLIVPKKLLLEGELLFASGFGACLALVLMSTVSFRIGFLHLCASFAIAWRKVPDATHES